MKSTLPAPSLHFFLKTNALLDTVILFEITRKRYKSNKLLSDQTTFQLSLYKAYRDQLQFPYHPYTIDIIIAIMNEARFVILQFNTN